MRPELLRIVNKKVYRRFPQVVGKKPRVQTRRSANGNGPTGGNTAGNTYLLIYETHIKLPAQKTLPLYVRVVIDERGRILKATMSR